MKIIRARSDAPHSPGHRNNIAQSEQANNILILDLKGNTGMTSPPNKPSF
jgi:hypothetical protein